MPSLRQPFSLPQRKQIYEAVTKPLGGYRAASAQTGLSMNAIGNWSKRGITKRMFPKIIRLLGGRIEWPPGVHPWMFGMEE